MFLLRRALLATQKNKRSQEPEFRMRGKICIHYSDYWLLPPDYFCAKSAILHESLKIMIRREMSDKPKSGFFRDDGTEINPSLIVKPSLCVSCKKDDDKGEEILCTLNRADQQGEKKFQCDAYESKWQLK
jgi:hypothetical protein